MELTQDLQQLAEYRQKVRGCSLLNNLRSD